MSLTYFYRSQIEKSPWRTILIGIVVMVVTMLVAVLVGRVLDTVPVVVMFDQSIYKAINLGPHPAWLNTIVSPFNFNFLPWGGTFIPSFLYFVFALGFIYIGIFHRKNIGWAFLALVVAMVVEIYIYKITHAYVSRDRPFVHLPNNLTDSAKAIWIKWPTYPSGHVRDMALYSTILSGYAAKLTIPFVILTLWIGYTRLYIGAHYPTDVLAGLAIGYLVGLGILLIIKSGQRLAQKYMARTTVEDTSSL